SRRPARRRRWSRSPRRRPGRRPFRNAERRSPTSAINSEARMRAARACLRAAVMAAVIALAPSAIAGGVSAADREAARGLAGHGYELFEAGQYERALDLFRQAEARYHAPPHLVYIARAQVKLGKLIEAEATYQQIIDEKQAADAPTPFREALLNARSEI